MAGLNKAATVTLGADGSGSCSLGPDDRGSKAVWNVDSLLWGNQNDARVGRAPIPRIRVYLDNGDPSGIQAQSYDGSFGSAGGSLELSRGSHLIASWSGGQAGDTMYLTVTGTMS